MKINMENVDHKQVYGEITKIYDLAEGIIDAIEQEDVRNPEEQIAIAEAVIEQAGESGDELSEVYVDFVENGCQPAVSRVGRIESAVRKVFISISDFDENLKKLVNEDEDDGSNKITIDDLKKKLKIIQILGHNLPESKIQKSLRKHALRLGLKYGGLLVMAIKRLGDHMLGLMHVFQTLGLGQVISAIPNRQGWKLQSMSHTVSLNVPTMKREGPGRGM